MVRVAPFFLTHGVNTGRFALRAMLPVINNVRMSASLVNKNNALCNNWSVVRTRDLHVDRKDGNTVEIEGNVHGSSGDEKNVAEPPRRKKILQGDSGGVVSLLDHVPTVGLPLRKCCYT